VYLIGLTGNIGAGKSTVARQLGELGAFVLDADQLYRGLIEPGQPGHRAVVDLFGDGVVAADGSIDRRRLGEIVFRDAAALGRLERATHPLVRARAEELIAAAKPRVAVYEAIKLIESGQADRCDEVWVVTAPRELQIERIMARNKVDRAEAERRIDAQPPQEEKVARADVVIENAGSLDDIRRQVLAAWERLTANDRSD
jgi:dephospho-CoA kinase